MAKQFRRKRNKKRICIFLNDDELKVIKARASAGFGGNVSLYLRTLGASPSRE